MPKQPIHTREYLPRVVMPDLRDIKKAVSEVEGFNAKVAVFITRGVGTMACAYVFAAIAVVGLPAALKPGGEGIISWIAQTFLQLVLLSIIMVGQSVQAVASDARANKEFQDTEIVMDRLDENTAGGIRTVLDRLDALEEKLGGRPSPPRGPDAVEPAGA